MTYHTKLKFIPRDEKSSYSSIAFGKDEYIDKINLRRYVACCLTLYQTRCIRSFTHSPTCSENVLVFDEISMISGETLDLINYLICKKMKNNRYKHFSLSYSLTHSLTHSLMLTHSLTHLLIHSLTRSLTHSRT